MTRSREIHQVIQRARVTLASIGMFACATLHAQPAADTPAAAAETQPTTATWELLAPLVVEKLDNDMTFLLYPNKRAPVFAGVVRFDVGGKDEVPGTTGIAHMFEHMAFKGSHTVGTRNFAGEQIALKQVEQAAVIFDRERNRIEQAAAAGRLTGEEAQTQLAAAREAFQKAQAVADQFVVKNEFDEIYNREGGSGMNAFTSSDATCYFISLPANRLPLWARMESDRLMNPVMREFYTERDVVMEERRMRNDNNPTGRLWELMMATAYTAHPYGYPVIGFESDIRNLKADEAYRFFQTHYTPDRALGVLVGDFDIEATRAMLRETFGKIPARRDQRAERRIIPEPPQEGERRATLEIPASPTVILGWHKPCAPSIDDVRAEVLQQVLTGGRSTRWFERLVKQDRVAADVGAFTAPGDAQPNMFMVYATPQGEVKLADLEKRLREEIKKLADEPITDEELARARKNQRADTTRALADNMGFALRLSEAAQISGDPYYLERRLRQTDEVTAADLQAFVRQYLVDDNLTVGLLQPPTADGDAKPAAEKQ